MMRRLILLLITLPLFLFAQDDLQPTGIEGLTRNSFILLDTTYTVRGERSIEIDDKLLAGRDINYVAFYVKNKLVAVDEIPPFTLTHDFGNFTQKVRIVAVGVQYNLEVKKPDEVVIKQVREGRELGAADPGKAVEVSDAEIQEAENFAPDDDSITIVSPTRDIYTYGVITIKAEVDAPAAAIVRVDFKVDGKLVGSADQAPFEVEHDFGRSFNEKKVEAIAIFKNGTRAETSMITVPLEQSDYFIRTQLVTVEATVVDWRDRIVPDLTKEDFRIWEDGVEQEVTHFSIEERPLRVAILIDASGSMQERDKMRRAIESAQQFLHFLDPAKDKVALVAFTDIPTLLSDFTNEFDVVSKLLARIGPKGGTAISDTLDAVAPLFEDEPGRKAVVLVTDGIDQHSTIHVNDAVQKVREVGAKIYSIGIYVDDYFDQQQQRSVAPTGTHRGKAPDLDPTDARKKDQTFKRGLDTRTVIFEGLADVSGGAAFFPETLRELPMIFQRIADELRNSYSLGFIPKNTARDGQWRELDIEVNRSGLTVKSKDGYRAKK